MPYCAWSACTRGTRSLPARSSPASAARTRPVPVATPRRRALPAPPPRPCGQPSGPAKPPPVARSPLLSRGPSPASGRLTAPLRTAARCPRPAQTAAIILSPISMNFVFFIPDELRAESVGCYGNDLVRSPNIDRLAAGGTRFDQCHVQHTVCTPSRCSFTTGWYPHVRGHRTLWHMLRPDEPNLLRSFKEAGYDVYWGGKNDLLAPESFPLSVSDYRLGDRSTRAVSGGGHGEPPYPAGRPALLQLPLRPPARRDRVGRRLPPGGRRRRVAALPTRPALRHLPPPQLPPLPLPRPRAVPQPDRSRTPCPRCARRTCRESRTSTA